MAKAIFFAIYVDAMWTEDMISRPIFHLCQQVQLWTLPEYKDAFFTISARGYIIFTGDRRIKCLISMQSDSARKWGEHEYREWIGIHQ